MVRSKTKVLTKGPILVWSLYTGLRDFRLGLRDRKDFRTDFRDFTDFANITCSGGFSPDFQAFRSDFKDFSDFKSDFKVFRPDTRDFTFGFQGILRGI